MTARREFSHAHAPAMYPLEEMNNDISTVTMNPYNMATIDSSENFDNYQFYYEKDPLPPSKDSTPYAETPAKSVWSTRNTITNESNTVKEELRNCCPCCAWPLGKVISSNEKTRSSYKFSNRKTGRSTQNEIYDEVEFDDFDREKEPVVSDTDYYDEEPQKNPKNTGVRPESDIVENTVEYNTLSPSNLPSEDRFLHKIPITSYYEDLPSNENVISIAGQGSTPIKSGRVANPGLPYRPVSVYPLPPPSYPAILPSQQFGYRPSGCPCAVRSAPPCCPPVQPCCLPTLPCCPPLPCCPRITICCQPPPQCCQPPPVCCQTLRPPPCLRACPTCPCRWRVHQALRMKRAPGFMNSGQCIQCTVSGEAKRTRTKRQSNCMACSNNPSSSLFAQHSSGCTSCRQSDRRTARVKRMGCVPCLRRMKRDVDDQDHRRVKRFGCIPCLGRKKRSFINCEQCSNLGQVLQRSQKMQCSPCGRKKRETKKKSTPTCRCAEKRFQSILKRIKKRQVDSVFDTTETCDKSCCDYRRCLNAGARKLRAPDNARI